MIKLLGFSGRIDIPTIIDVTDTEALLVRKDGDGGDVFVVDTSNGVVAIGGVAPVTGCRLVLPQENDAVTPTLAFGDGDTGFYESAANTIKVAVAGNPIYSFEVGKFSPHTAGAGALMAEAASNTNPTLVPEKDDVDTGIGRAGANQLSLIANGAEGARVDANNTARNTRLLVYDVDNGTLERVTVGAADSGGSGYKYLRIPN